MENLKQALTTELFAHVEVVYFDRDGNWYLNKTKDTVSSKTVKEILSDGEETEKETEPKKKKK